MTMNHDIMSTVKLSRLTPQLGMVYVVYPHCVGRLFNCNYYF
jgi:hypothetical protein